MLRSGNKNTAGVLSFGVLAGKKKIIMCPCQLLDLSSVFFLQLSNHLSLYKLSVTFSGFSLVSNMSENGEKYPLQFSFL